MEALFVSVTAAVETEENVFIKNLVNRLADGRDIYRDRGDKENNKVGN